jgi:hypothetical protein
MRGERLQQLIRITVARGGDVCDDTLMINVSEEAREFCGRDGARECWRRGRVRSIHAGGAGAPSPIVSRSSTNARAQGFEHRQESVKLRVVGRR